MRSHSLLTLCTLLMTIQPIVLNAQVRPDAGQSLQELKQQNALPTPTQAEPIKVELEKEAAKTGGVSVTIKTVVFKGNTVFSEEALLKVITPFNDRPMTLGEIKDLGVKLTNYYRTNGYPFSKVIIPPQEISTGNLIIEVFEGKYGEIRLIGDSVLTEGIRPYTEPLVPGEVIANADLERVTQLIDDLPGISQTPVIRPSKTLGAGDLLIEVKEEERASARIGINNFGNAYTGRVQNSLSADFNRLFMVGDQLSVNGMVTEENMWLGSVQYERPLLARGLRVNAGYIHTFYTLKKEFAYLGAHGRGNIVSVGGSYPLIKSQIRNVPISLTASHKRLSDKQDTFLVKEYKSVNSLTANISADNRDRFLGSGLTYGTFGITLGKLHLDRALESVDRTTADSNGGFVKYNLNVARIQALPLGFLFFQNFGLQFANKNLDSSEGFGAGGVAGVRAYPSGEGYGDEGFTSQSELRYSINHLSPFVFFDYGHTKINRKNYSTSKNTRNLAGTGLGVRGEYKNLNASLVSAWRTQGGKAQSYSKDYIPMIWFNTEYNF